MELREYWNIVTRRWWLPVGLVFVVAIFSLAAEQPWKPSVPTYTASLRYNVGLQPEPRTGDYYTYDRYYTWLGSEYLIDDLSEIIKGSEFAATVSKHLENVGIQMPAGVLQGSTQAGKLHRILTISVSRENPGELLAITRAISETMQQDLPLFYAGLLDEKSQTSPVRAILVDGPSISVNGVTLRERIDLPVRLALALFVGILATFFINYLDPNIRDSDELDALELRVLGEIPRKG